MQAARASIDLFMRLGVVGRHGCFKCQNLPGAWAPGKTAVNHGPQSSHSMWTAAAGAVSGAVEED